MVSGRRCMVVAPWEGDGGARPSAWAAARDCRRVPARGCSGRERIGAHVAHAARGERPTLSSARHTSADTTRLVDSLKSTGSGVEARRRRPAAPLGAPYALQHAAW